MNLRKSKKYSWMAPTTKVLKAGEANVATRFKDFTCEVASFCHVVYLAAADMGLKATLVVEGDSVMYAFYKEDSFMRPNLKAYPVVRKAKGYTV